MCSVNSRGEQGGVPREKIERRSADVRIRRAFLGREAGGVSGRPPAGYLRSVDGTTPSVRTAASELLSAARSLKLAMIVGVDACSNGERKKLGLEQSVAAGTLPFFAVAWAPGMREPIVWQQRSTTSTDWRSTPPALHAEVRILRVGDRDVAPVLCGEAFSGAVRGGVVNRGASLAVLLAHGAAGLRHWQALRWFSTNGVDCVRSVHAKDAAENALWRRRSKVPPSVGAHRTEAKDFWAAASVFDV